MTSTIIHSPYSEVAIPEVSLPAFVFADAASRADKPALIDGLSGRAITYGELVGGARLVAGGLAARGFQAGEVFAIYLPNLPEYAVAFYGVLLAGGTNTTINPLYTVEELAAQLKDAGARYLLTIPPFLDKAIEAAGRSGVREVFVLGEAQGATPFAALLRSGHQPPEVTIDPHRDLATVPYSSGTTGLPKGVMLTHHNLVANLCQFQSVVDLGEEETGVAVLPFFHLYGQVVLMAAAVARWSPCRALTWSSSSPSCRTTGSPGRRWSRRSCSRWPSIRWWTGSTCRGCGSSSRGPRRWAPSWRRRAVGGWAVWSARATG